MRNVFPTILATIFMVFCIDTYAIESTPAQLTKQTDELSSLIRDSYASEYSRNIYLFSHKDSERGAIVLLNLEGFSGGNNSSQYMAIFSVLSGSEDGGKPIPDYYSLIDFIQIGSRGLRFVDSDKITHTYDEKTHETVITVPFLKYGEEDGLCCPSVKGSATYRVTAQKGQRINVQTK